MADEVRIVRLLRPPRRRPRSTSVPAGNPGAGRRRYPPCRRDPPPSRWRGRRRLHLLHLRIARPAHARSRWLTRPRRGPPDRTASRPRRAPPTTTSFSPSRPSARTHHARSALRETTSSTRTPPPSDTAASPLPTTVSSASRRGAAARASPPSPSARRLAQRAQRPPTRRESAKCWRRMHALSPRASPAITWRSAMPSMSTLPRRS